MTTFSDFQVRRFARLLREHRERFALDLSGLTVYTEAATGYYMLTPVMCALCGAAKVHALARDSRYGSAAQVIEQSRALMERFGCAERVVFHERKEPASVAEADIVMNAGAVRPIDAEMVSWMKPTAVVPLMWETWEFRPDELDLAACKAKGVLVMGTDEVTLDRFPFAGYLPLKLLFQCDVEVFKCRLLLMGSGRSGRGMVEVFRKNGIDLRWVCLDEDVPEHLRGLRIDHADKRALLDWVAKCEALVCFEHAHDRPIIAEGGILSPEELRRANDSLTVVHVSGVLDVEGVCRAGLNLHPKRQVPFGTMTVGTWEMGPRSIIELTMAGIKVGEAMARARLKGLSPALAAREAMRSSLAQDFEGDLAWIKEGGA